MAEEVWTIGGGLSKFDEMMEWIKGFNVPVTDVFTEVYDTHSSLPLNGGRYQRSHYKWSLAESARRILKWNAKGMLFDLTFNNTLLTPDVLDNLDEDITWFIEQVDNDKNGVIVADMDLKDWFKSNYPGFRLSASTCFDNSDPEYLAALCDEFDIVCLPLWANKSWDVLSELEISKLKIIVDLECKIGCQYHTPKDHYDAVSQLILGTKRYWRDDNEVYTCKMEVNDEVVYHTENTKMFPEDMAKAREIGIRRFKIASRTNNMLRLSSAVEEYRGINNVYACTPAGGVAPKFRTE